MTLPRRLPAPALLSLLILAACRSTPDYSAVQGVTGPQLLGKSGLPEPALANRPPRAGSPAQSALQEPLPEVPIREEAQAAAATMMEQALSNEQEEVEPPAPQTLSQTSEEREQRSRDIRREQILEQLGEKDISLGKLLAFDEYDGPILAGEALEAYAAGENVRAVLLAQAALGADPGNLTRRRMLDLLVEKTGVAADPEGVVPKEALVQRELSRADRAFFNEDFGSAVQHCRRAIFVDPLRPLAWQKLGSAQLAAGDRARARASYLKAMELDAEDRELRSFMARRGWTD